MQEKNKVSNDLIREKDTWFLNIIWDSFDRTEKIALNYIADELETEDDISIQFLEKPSYSKIIEALTEKENNPVISVSKLISKGIISPTGDRLDFGMDMLRKWMCQNPDKVDEDIT